MYIKCWGARGSAPACGKEFVEYGGHTSCLEIRVNHSGQTIIIDLGTGVLECGQELLNQERTKLSILLTHTHWDHIQGFPLLPLLYCSKAKLKFYYNPRYQGNPALVVTRDLLSAPHFPVHFAQLPAELSYHQVQNDFNIGSLEIKSIPLSHPNLGLGYRMSYKNKSLVFLTDNELGYRHPGSRSFVDYIQFCSGADLLIHDAEFYTRQEYQQFKGFGHSLLEDVLQLAQRAEVNSLGLFHHNRDRTDEQIKKAIARLHANQQDKFHCQIFALAQGQEIEL